MRNGNHSSGGHIQRLRHIGQWLLHSRLIFDLGALPYDLMTANDHWRRNCTRLLEGLPTTGRLRVLDLGIGPGVSAFAMGRQHPNAEFVGLDLVYRMLERAQQNRRRHGWPEERLRLLRGDALHLPLADESVDAVTGHSFLYLLPDSTTVLAEVFRVLRPGGYVAFLEPNAGTPDWSWLLQQASVRLYASLSLWRFYSWLHGQFSAGHLQTALEQAGFTDVTTEGTLGGFGIFGRGRKP